MSLFINTVRVCNFRGISDLELSLLRTTVLFGGNNAGKTSIIKALQFALGDYSRFLSREDFHIDASDMPQTKITVDLRIVPEGQEEFSEEWYDIFADNIQSLADGSQFIAIRTVAEPDTIKGGYKVARYYLNEWPEYENWSLVTVKNTNKIRKRFESLPFISVDAQRDIHNELKDKMSFINRILSEVQYSESAVTDIETKIAELNALAVDTSVPLQKLKANLGKLSDSLSGDGIADITPFSKKVRDLSKQFCVHFGESDNSSFSIEYHGMGTRSWASMLTVKAFIELLSDKYLEESQPFFPILAAEEPEAHLHPNAQRTLYQQLREISGQVIISTHSPYILGTSDIKNLRGVVRESGNVKVTQLIEGLDTEDINTLNREIMNHRGELLFSKAIVLFEGVTEEQILPSILESYFGKSCFSLGINCISVGGINYAAYIKMAFSFGIPVCILSDNDGNTKTKLTSLIEKIERSGVTLLEDDFLISYLGEGNDIEAELVLNLDIEQEIKQALLAAKTRDNNNERYIDAQRRCINSFGDNDLIESMRKSKASYAGYLGGIIDNYPSKEKEMRFVSPATLDVIEKLEGWI